VLLARSAPAAVVAVVVVVAGTVVVVGAVVVVVGAVVVVVGRVVVVVGAVVVVVGGIVVDVVGPEGPAGAGVSLSVVGGAVLVVEDDEVDDGVPSDSSSSVARMAAPTPTSARIATTSVAMSARRRIRCARLAPGVAGGAPRASPAGGASTAVGGAGNSSVSPPRVTVTGAVVSSGTSVVASVASPASELGLVTSVPPVSSGPPSAAAADSVTSGGASVSPSTSGWEGASSPWASEGMATRFAPVEQPAASGWDCTKAVGKNRRS
jgi:hypothetical protein